MLFDYYLLNHQKPSRRESTLSYIHPFSKVSGMSRTIISIVLSNPMLSNLSGTMGRIRIDLEAMGCNSKHQKRFSEHYKLRGCNSGPFIPVTSMKRSPWHHISTHDDPQAIG